MAADARDGGLDSPADIEARSWWAIIKRTVTEFRDDDLTDSAAALTYYGIMSLFPMLIALVAVLGLLGSQSSITSLVNSLDEVGLGGIAKGIRQPLNEIVNQHGSAGVLFVV